MNTNEFKNNKLSIYNKIYDRLVNNTESFAIISKTLDKNINITPGIYLNIANSNKINLENAVGSDVTAFDIYVYTNLNTDNYDNLSDNEVLMNLSREVEYALAKPMNWRTNHLGLPNIVKNAQFNDVQFFPDETNGGGNIFCILTFLVTHTADGYLRPPEPMPES